MMLSSQNRQKKATGVMLLSLGTLDSIESSAPLIGLNSAASCSICSVALLFIRFADSGTFESHEESGLRARLAYIIDAI